MVSIALNPDASLELRGRMNAELAQYVYPKRKAVELAGTVGFLRPFCRPIKKGLNPPSNPRSVE
jgi:hypothetical protein